MIVYLRLGYRFRLLSFLSASLLLQHSQKVYLLTVRVLLPEYYKPCLLASIAILVNSFFVAAYNLSLIAICIHVYLLIQAAGTGYDHVRAQIRYIQVICCISTAQLLHQMWHSRASLGLIESLPYYWIQFVILCGQVLVCPILVGHLLWKCWRARERTMDLLRRSSISSSLMWRLMGSLLAVAIMTGRTIVIQIANNEKFGGKGSFGGFEMWKATAGQLAARYQIGNIVGPVLMIIFLTAQEPSDYVIEKLVVLRDITLCRNRKRRRSSSIPWLESDGNHGRAGYRESGLVHTSCPAAYGQRSVTGSMNPRESRLQRSVDLTIDIGSLRQQQSRTEAKRARIGVSGAITGGDGGGGTEGPSTGGARRNSDTEIAKIMRPSGRSASLDPTNGPSSLERSESMKA